MGHLWRLWLGHGIQYLFTLVSCQLPVASSSPDDQDEKVFRESFQELLVLQSYGALQFFHGSLHFMIHVSIIRHYFCGSHIFK